MLSVNRLIVLLVLVMWRRMMLSDTYGCGLSYPLWTCAKSVRIVKVKSERYFNTRGSSRRELSSWKVPCIFRGNTGTYKYGISKSELKQC